MDGRLSIGGFGSLFEHFLTIVMVHTPDNRRCLHVGSSWLSSRSLINGCNMTSDPDELERKCHASTGWGWKRNKDVGMWLCRVIKWTGTHIQMQPHSLDSNTSGTKMSDCVGRENRVLCLRSQHAKQTANFSCVRWSQLPLLVDMGCLWTKWANVYGAGRWPTGNITIILDQSVSP